MNERELEQLLEGVRERRIDVEAARERLSALALDLGHSRLDLDRERRCGFPEVIYAEGKALPQLLESARALHAHHARLLVTRTSEEQAAALLEALPTGTHHREARCVAWGAPESQEGHIAVLSAGTCDAPVAAEAALTARMLGARVEEYRDVGVAGLHRLLGELEAIREARALVVVAGMEGALPSVVAGLVAAPIWAVPTSVGYGTGLGGLAAVLAMLNSCAAGVSVVNIDNGFGAGYAAALANRNGVSCGEVAPPSGATDTNGAERA